MARLPRRPRATSRRRRRARTVSAERARRAAAHRPGRVTGLRLGATARPVLQSQDRLVRAATERQADQVERRAAVAAARAPPPRSLPRRQLERAARARARWAGDGHGCPSPSRWVDNARTIDAGQRRLPRRGDCRRCSHVRDVCPSDRRSEEGRATEGWMTGTRATGARRATERAVLSGRPRQGRRVRPPVRPRVSRPVRPDPHRDGHVPDDLLSDQPSDTTPPTPPDRRLRPRVGPTRRRPPAPAGASPSGASPSRSSPRTTTSTTSWPPRAMRSPSPMPTVCWRRSSAGPPRTSSRRGWCSTGSFPGSCGLRCGVARRVGGRWLRSSTS